MIGAEKSVPSFIITSRHYEDNICYIWYLSGRITCTDFGTMMMPVLCASGYRGRLAEDIFMDLVAPHSPSGLLR